MKISWYIWVLLAVVLINSSCSRFQRIQKSGSIVEKYDAAVKYYNEGDYYRAGLLFEELVPLLRGKAEAEDAEFYYAYCQYYQRALLLSSYYFRKFYETYPRGKFAEEAFYMHCRSLFEISAPEELDQANTSDAIESIQSFLKRFPDSKYRDQVNSYSAGLSAKLNLKHFDSAKLYFKIRRYRSAVVALDNYRKDYPDSPYLDHAAFLRFSSQYEYAKRSIRTKQEERYYEAIEYYENFVDKYPDSEYVKEAENIYEHCINRISSLKKKKS